MEITELHVHVLEARNLADVEMLGKQDPFVKVQAGGQKFETKVHSNGGTTPKWKQWSPFDIAVAASSVGTMSIFFEILDKGTLSNSTIGKCSYSLGEVSDALRTGRFLDLWVPVLRDHKHHGELHVHIHLTGPGITNEKPPFDYELCASKSGFLVKRGGFIKNWRRRWFIVRGNKLGYYVNGGPKPSDMKGELDIAFARVEYTNIGGAEHVIEIACRDGGRHLYVSAANEDERAQWLVAFRAGAGGKYAEPTFVDEARKILGYSDAPATIVPVPEAVMGTAVAAAAPAPAVAAAPAPATAVVAPPPVPTSAGYPAASAGYPAASAGYPAASAGYPAASGGYPGSAAASTTATTVVMTAAGAQQAAQAQAQAQYAAQQQAQQAQAQAQYAAQQAAQQQAQYAAQQQAQQAAAQSRLVAEEMAMAEQRRQAEERRIAEQRRLEAERRYAEEQRRQAEQQRMAQERAMEQQRLAQQRAMEQQRMAQQAAMQQQRMAEQMRMQQMQQQRVVAAEMAAANNMMAAEMMGAEMAMEGAMMANNMNMGMMGAQPMGMGVVEQTTVFPGGFTETTVVAPNSAGMAAAAMEEEIAREMYETNFF